MEINLGVVAGRRPDLLRRTILSFKESLFSSCRVKHVRVNLDPIFGDEKDEVSAKNCIQEFFPEATINTPEKPSFGAAVKWVWSGMPDGPFLHLEDDWICMGSIPVKEILTQLNEATPMITITATNHRSPGKSRERTRVKKHRFLGITYKRETVPEFGTSPCFVSGEFARNISRLLNTSLDPEKQMRDNYNPQLMAYLRSRRCLFQASLSGEPLIHDIGREWREGRKITKIVKNGISRWERK